MQGLSPIPAWATAIPRVAGQWARAATTEPVGCNQRALHEAWAAATEPVSCNQKALVLQLRTNTAKQSNKQPLKKKSEDGDPGAGKSIRAADSEAQNLSFSFFLSRKRWGRGWGWSGAGTWKAGHLAFFYLVFAAVSSATPTSKVCFPKRTTSKIFKWCLYT